MKPKIRSAASISNYFKYVCRGIRPDGVDAFGIGHTMEQAYADWLVYDEADIPF